MKGEGAKTNALVLVLLASTPLSDDNAVSAGGGGEEGGVLVYFLPQSFDPRPSMPFETERRSYSYLAETPQHLSAHYVSSMRAGPA